MNSIGQSMISQTIIQSLMIVKPAFVLNIANIQVSLLTFITTTFWLEILTNIVKSLYRNSLKEHMQYCLIIKAFCLTGLSKRVSFENKMDESVHDLQTDYAIYKNEFHRFFPQLITFADGKKM